MQRYIKFFTRDSWRMMKVDCVLDEKELAPLSFTTNQIYWFILNE